MFQIVLPDDCLNLVNITAIRFVPRHESSRCRTAVTIELLKLNPGHQLLLIFHFTIKVVDSDDFAQKALSDK
jgi:hypothetical protein